MAGCTSVSKVQPVRGRLYINATLPHREGKPGNKQYKLTLKLDDTSQNRKIAERRRIQLDKELAAGTFDWDNWLETDKTLKWRDGIQLLYRKKVLYGRLSESTWNRSYMGRLRQLNPLEPITTEAIESAVTRYDRTQCSYKLMFYLMKDIAALTGVPFPQLGVPLYGERETELLVPTDDEIIDWVKAAKEPHRYYFGLMATFGIRPHEADSATLLPDDNLQVKEDTKTGSRIVIPLHPEWIMLFDLRKKKIRPATDRIVPVPDECSQWLNKERLRLGIKWRSYALRHAYAARLWRLGGGQLDIYTAARLMGHTTKEHEKTYRSHIQPFTIARSAQDAIARNFAQSRQLLDESGSHASLHSAPKNQ